MVSGSWGPVDHEKMMAVTGETCLYSKTDKSTLLEYFQFLATDHGQCLQLLTSVLFLLPWATEKSSSNTGSMQKVWKQKTSLC